MANPTTNQKNSSAGNGILAKLVVLAMIACGGAGLALAVHANYMSPYTAHTKRFVVENWNIVLIALEVVLAYILKRLQGGAYWFSWLQLRKPVLDERQKQVRQKVFERAYAFMLIMFLITVVDASNERVQYATSGPGNYNLIARVAWAVGVFAVALPSVFAAWRKDS